jgi:aryl-alcohol dehydrogenase-like predicted oxidoreductase
VKLDQDLPTLKHAFERRRRPLYPNSPNSPNVSIIGFGAMRIAEDQEESGSGKAALLHALRLGVNLIDCGGTAFDAQNELAVGQVLREFAVSKSDAQDLPVLVTRVGALRGRNLEYFFARERRNEAGEVFFLQNGDAVTFAEENLRAQITSSCARLGVAKLDAVLLDTPELYLQWARERRVDPSTAHAQLLQKLTEAFGALQRMAEEGLIGCYGISSQVIGYPLNHPVPIDIDCVFNALELVRQHASSPCLFRLVALPLNWIELTGVERSHEAAEPLLDLLRQKGVGVLACRPLNALSQGKLVRLARPDLTDAKLSSLNEAQMRGLENWAQLSLDLERMAQEVIEHVGYEDAPLSQLAMATVASLPEVSSVLVGMRRVSYVEDALEAVSRPLILRGREIIAKIHDNLVFDAGDSPVA